MLQQLRRAEPRNRLRKVGVGAEVSGWGGCVGGWLGWVRGWVVRVGAWMYEVRGG